MYRYYRCNKRNDNGCKNKTIPKDYIEDKVVGKLKTLLTDKNIEKISKKMHMKRSTVNYHKHRIYKILREQLTNLEEWL